MCATVGAEGCSSPHEYASLRGAEQALRKHLIRAVSRGSRRSSGETSSVQQSSSTRVGSRVERSQGSPGDAATVTRFRTETVILAIEYDVTHEGSSSLSPSSVPKMKDGQDLNGQARQAWRRSFDDEDTVASLAALHRAISVDPQLAISGT
jgi:hypothetical protein